MKTVAFWDVAPYGLRAQVIALIMEAVRTFETSVNFNVTTGRCIPEDSKLKKLECWVTIVKPFHFQNMSSE
jgi:hypothetical protein